MHIAKLCLSACAILVAVLLLPCCNAPSNSTATKAPATLNVDTLQIADYVVKIFEDKNGTLWFGTVLEGVARYDGQTLTYLTKEDGLVDNTVTAIVEDKHGNLWFGTHGGLSKWDGKTITNYTTNEGLCHNAVSQLLIDQSGTIWVGTWGGVCRYDGVLFTKFDLPVPEVELLPYQNSLNWVTEIMEDTKGNIWFGRDGYGACKFDGKQFTHFTKKQGLASNNVQVIREDHQGHIWFGARIVERDSPDPNARLGRGGLCRFDGDTIVQFPEVEGLMDNETYAIHVDRAGNVWIGANKYGLYRYDGKGFTSFRETDRVQLTTPYGYGIQHIHEDRNGTIWLGLSGGLCRLEGTLLRNVRQGGPWE